jgi:DNA polymerase elongation subunit (family B)
MHVFRQRFDGTMMTVLDQLIERKINIIPKKKKCTIEDETSHGLPI